jgi:TonB family protein
MIEDHDLDPLPGLPDDLAELDAELRDIRMAERPSFGPELRAELAREWEEGPRPLESRWSTRRALAASIGAVILVSLAVPPARASLVELSRQSLQVLGVVDPPSAEARPGPGPVGPRPGPMGLPASPRVASSTAGDVWPGPGPDGVDDPGVLPSGANPGPEAVPPAVRYPRLADRLAERRAVQRHYPEYLQREGVGGAVRLRMWVARDGSVENPSVLEGSGVAELDRAALRAGRELHFVPAERNGRAVGTWVEFNVVFEPIPEVRALPAIRPVEGPDLPEEVSFDGFTDQAPVVSAPYRLEARQLLSRALGPAPVERLGPLEHLLAGEPAPGMSPLRWRAEAARVLEAAIVRDPGNPAPYLALARIRTRQGLRAQALELLEQGLDRSGREGRSVSPRLLAELNFERGRVLEDEWLAWRSLGRLASTRGIAPGCPPVSPSSVEALVALNYLCPAELDRLMAEAFDPTDPAAEARTRMRTAYQAAVEAYPAHVGANVRLLLDLADQEAWYDVLRDARRFAWASRGHPHAGLLSALALHRLGRVEDAEEDFRVALEALDPAERRWMESVAVLGAEQAEDTPEGRAAFWRARDPVLSTEVNERRVEHLARASYVLLRFGSPEDEVSRVWLRYGRPDAIRTLGEGSDLRTEFWDYGSGPDLTFRRPPHSLDLSLTSEGRAYLEDLRDVLPHWIGNRTRPVTELEAQAVRSRGREPGAVQVDVHLRTPSGIATSDADSLDLGIFVVDTGGHRLDEHRERILARSGTMTRSVEAPSGAEAVVIEVYHRGTSRVAGRRLDVGETAGAPSTSDLLLTEPGSPSRAPADPTDGRLVPRTDGADASGEALGVVFTLYDVPASRDGYRLRAELAHEEGAAMIPLPVRPAGAVLFDGSWLREIPAGGGTVTEYLTLDLSGVPAGSYRLDIVVELPEGHEPVRISRAVERAGPTGG